MAQKNESFNVSVSAVTPCLVSANSLSLQNHFKCYANMETPTAHARYERMWHEFLSALEHHPTLHLTPYLRSRHVYHRGFQKWMYANGHSVGEARGRLLALAAGLSGGSSPDESPSFLPVRISETGRHDVRGSDLLTGVSLTLPDGTVVGIRRGSAEAVVSFLKLYSGEGSPCSD